jgi:hypothetical protein
VGLICVVCTIWIEVGKAAPRSLNFTTHCSVCTSCFFKLNSISGPENLSFSLVYNRLSSCLPMAYTAPLGMGPTSADRRL